MFPRRLHPIEVSSRPNKRIVLVTHYLRISPEFLDARLSRETNTAGPLYGLPTDLLCNDTGKVLGHCSLFGEGFTFIPSPSSVVGHQSGSFEIDGSLSDGESHALEGSDRLAKLVSLICVRDSLVEGALSESDHLCGDANSTWSND